MGTAMALLCSSRTFPFPGMCRWKTSQTWPLNEKCVPREEGESLWNRHSLGSCSWIQGWCWAGTAWAPSQLQFPPPDLCGHKNGTSGAWIAALNNVAPPGQSQLSEMADLWPCIKKVLLNLTVLRVLGSLPAVPRFRKASLAPNSCLVWCLGRLPGTETGLN